MAERIDPTAEKWRESLLRVVAPDLGCPVLLSGGVDSSTILAATIALGDRPRCYTFTVGDSDSIDLRVSRLMCDAYDLELVVVRIPRDVDVLTADVESLIRELGTSRKTAVQCCHPIAYLADRISEDGFDRAFVGTGGVVEDNRKCAVILHREGEEAARAYRRSQLLDTEGSATWHMHATARRRGVRLVEPYSTQPHADHALSLNVAEINRPKQKGIALRAFPEFWRGRPWYRKNQPLQCASRLREFHDVLLKTPLNRGGHRSVVGVYNAIARRVGTC